MSSKLEESVPVNTNLIRSHQVSPLPVGSGGNSLIKKQLNDTNVQLSLLTAQATVNTKYDPPVPRPVTKAVIKETFTNGIVSPTLFVIGGLLIVYGLVAK